FLPPPPPPPPPPGWGVGGDLLISARDERGRVDLHAALAMLGERGLTRLCSEGGPHLADALAEADLVDTCTLITGPGTCGPQGGLPAVGPHLGAMLDGERFRIAESLDLGADRATTYERNEA
ncbi:hypothetical protein FV219_15960, partial [Methylobacterium sp. WL122]